MGTPYTPGVLDLLIANARRRPELIAYRSDLQLRRLIRHAWTHVPLYRRMWESAGFSPERFRGGIDLGDVPFVDKDALATAGDQARDSSVPFAALCAMTTSGTSGRSITAYTTVAEMRVLRRSIVRHALRVGARPLDRVLTVASSWLRDRKGMIVEALTRWSGSQHLELGDPLDRQLELLLSMRPDSIFGQTGGIYLLARELGRRNLTLPVNVVVTTGTTLLGDMRRTIAGAFCVEPRDLYGAVEVGPIAWQCRRGNYHVDADRIAVEIVDDAGHPVPRGRRGHVVVTSLYQYTMPFIRYRLRDIAALSLRQCDCGCRFPLMEPIEGRINDFLSTPRGDLVTPHFFFHLFDHAPRNPVRDWRVVQEDIHHMVYEYVPGENFCATSLAAGIELIRGRFGPDCHVQGVQVSHLPLASGGKRRCIVSRLRPATLGFDKAWTSNATPAPGKEPRCSSAAIVAATNQHAEELVGASV